MTLYGRPGQGYSSGMNKDTHIRPIRLLPQPLRNQIAAGEVVERPASVLKELVENSLDAGATDISVTLEDGGQTLLAVRDNGHGIPERDLELAVTRHATSKVASFADLLQVASYGFRGEALPSIGSVADLLVESAFCPNPGDAAQPCADGAFIRVRHGEIDSRGPSALQRGSLVEVRDLFANVPARLKFLKSPATELKRCQECFMKLALVRPGVSFSLSTGSGGKRQELTRLAAGESLHERLQRLWPPHIAEGLRAFSGGRAGLSVHGLASLPQAAQARGDRILLYVNKRPVQNRLLLQAVRESYKGCLTSREFPQIVLFLDVDPAEVDVNVHPAKSEVRFRDERAVFGLVLKSLQSAIAGYGPGSPLADDSNGERGWRSDALREAPRVQAELPPLYAGGTAGATENLPEREQRDARPQGFWGSLDRPRLVEVPPLSEQTEAGSSQDEQAFAPSAYPERVPPPGSAPPFADAPAMALLHERGAVYGEQPSVPPYAFVDERMDDSHPEALERVAAGGAGAAVGLNRPGGGYPISVGPFTCLGQVAGTYLVLVEGDSLLLMDQHAAHERILLHKIEQQTGSSRSQLLALPVDMPLHPAEAERLQEVYGRLVGMGFSLSLNENSLSVSGVPPLLGRTDSLALLRDILSGRTDGLSDVLHMMACRSAVKAGQILTADEAAGLLAQWLQTPDRMFCPHGRPTLLSFGKGELEKMFKRKIG